MSDKKLAVPLLLKSHVDQYVKKDGTVVQAHDDKRQAAAPANDRKAALAAYAEKRKLAGEHGQAALDAAEKARSSQDPAHAADAISAVEKGWNAHKEAGKAARAIPYPGSSSPWEHHDERTSALSKMSEEMHQLHQKLSKKAAAKPKVPLVPKKAAGPKPGHMDVSTLAAGHHLLDKSGQKVDEVESVEKHPMGGLKVNTRAGYSHMVSKDGRNDHGLTNKAPGTAGGAQTAEDVKAHAVAAGAKYRANVAVFSDAKNAHSRADAAKDQKGGAFVMKHPDHGHHVVVGGADAQRMEKNGYTHVKPGA